MKSIIRRIGRFLIAATSQPVPVKAQPQVRTIPPGVGTRRQPQFSTINTVGHHVAGNLSLEQLKELSSSRVKDAIFNYAAWLCLARAFNTFCKTVAKRMQGQQALDVARELNEFHDWNASMTNPMDAARIEEIVAKLATPQVPRENNATDAILARIKGMSIDEVRKVRLEKAEEQAKAREAKITTFLTEVEGMADAEDCGNPSINAQTATLKAIDCLQWLANWENPDMGELVIAEADIATLEAYAHVADLKTGAGESSREIDEALLNAEEMHQGVHHSHM
ncbi:MAG TPA: hypothetical protein PLW92_02525 [Chitinophagales bacterium]|nr:hypothetical protein [Chitinophagales bacterium]